MIFWPAPTISLISTILFFPSASQGIAILIATGHINFSPSYQAETILDPHLLELIAPLNLIWFFPILVSPKSLIYWLGFLYTFITADFITNFYSILAHCLMWASDSQKDQEYGFYSILALPSSYSYSDHLSMNLAFTNF